MSVILFFRLPLHLFRTLQLPLHIGSREEVASTLVNRSYFKFVSEQCFQSLLKLKPFDRIRDTSYDSIACCGIGTN